ncbi:thioredoxin-dependent thiol peroxidase [soil metagenome]
MSTTEAPILPEVGKPAPAIRLPDDTGALRDLAEERGRWVVLYFYPADDTPGCTTEACQFRDSHAAFLGMGATVWGISKLGSASKAAFKAKHGLNYPLLADEDHDVARRYGVWVEKKQYGRSSMGIARSTFLIDPGGRVAHIWESVKADGHAAEVMAALGSVPASDPAR